MTSNLFDRLLELLKGPDQAEASQQEREALLDLMVWTMFVDRHVARAEQSYIKEQTEGMEWAGAYPPEVYLDASVRRIRDALGSEAAEDAYLEDILARLTAPAARERAYLACTSLAGADGEMAPAEAAHLQRLKVRLEV